MKKKTIKPSSTTSFSNPFSNYINLYKYLWLSFGFLVLLIPLWIVSIRHNLWHLYGDLPSLSILENPKSDLSSELYSADGILLGKYFRNNRSPVVYEELSPYLVETLLATEDYRFFQHAGIDLKGLSRVLFFSILLNRNTGGGSTISQQLAKNLFKTRSTQYQGHLSKIPILRTIIMKIKEWIVAVQLERAYTKEEILTMYLNTVDFGSNSFGIKVASKTFFNTSPDMLTLEQAALLVGILKAPTRYSPILNPENALRRRNIVLAQLKKYQVIDIATYDSLTQLPFSLSYKVDNHHVGLAPYFRSMVRNFLVKWTKKHGYDLFEDGLKIYTTIDSRMQQYAEEVIASHMKKLQEQFYKHWEGHNPWIDEQENEIDNFIEIAIKRTSFYKNLIKKYGHNNDSIQYYLHFPRSTQLFSWNGNVDSVISPVEELKYHKHMLHTGFMAMDVHSGYIRAWVGGINHQHFQYDHVTSKRQPGSAFKPIVYAAALENGYTPDYEVVDAPVIFKVANNVTWIPKNTNGRYTGQSMTLRQALSRSVNSITAYLTQQLGAQLIIDYAKRLGIQGPMQAVPALCLGASDVSLYEMIGAYNAFVNHGMWTNPHYITHIEDKNGHIIANFSPLQKEALNEAAAQQMVYMLQGTVEEQGGTARGLSKQVKENNEIAGKTGTSSNHSDGWFVGITKDLTAGAWVGGEDRCIRFRTLNIGQGAVLARPIWEQFMLKVYADTTLTYTKGPFNKIAKP